jgi:glycosyltransferase involved in cell wall biosynthesis
VSQLAVHVVYEHSGEDPRPFGSSHLRLLRPLAHPSAAALRLTYGRAPPLGSERVDLVVLDRRLTEGLTAGAAAALVAEQRELGRRVVAALDDDLPGAAADPRVGPAAAAAAEALVREADAVLVTTERLRERLAPLNPRIRVVPNALDERLLAARAPRPRPDVFGKRPLVVGLMGTRSHDDDARVVREAWPLVLASGCDVRLELVGAVLDPQPWLELGGRLCEPPPTEQEYPLFMAWWTSELDWDVGLAPLADTPFNATKSPLKVLDLAAAGAAGVFSRVPPYTEAVVSERTGLLVANEPEAWAEAILRLAGDDKLRLRLARAAAAALWSEGVLARQGGALVDALVWAART